MAIICTCSEGFTFRVTGQDRDRKRLYSVRRTPTELQVHDCAYIALRNSLIPQAVRDTLDEVGDDKKLWTRALLANVEKLYQEAKELWYGKISTASHQAGR